MRSPPAEPTGEPGATRPRYRAGAESPVANVNQRESLVADINQRERRNRGFRGSSPEQHGGRATAKSAEGR